MSNNNKQGASHYLQRVKQAYTDRPDLYKEFLRLLTRFRSHEIDTEGVVQGLYQVFQSGGVSGSSRGGLSSCEDNTSPEQLLLGFQAFLPAGCTIEWARGGDARDAARIRPVVRYQQQHVGGRSVRGAAAVVAAAAAASAPRRMGVNPAPVIHQPAAPPLRRRQLASTPAAAVSDAFLPPIHGSTTKASSSTSTTTAQQQQQQRASSFDSFRGKAPAPIATNQYVAAAPVAEAAAAADDNDDFGFGGDNIVIGLSESPSPPKKKKSEAPKPKKQQSSTSSPSSSKASPRGKPKKLSTKASSPSGKPKKLATSAKSSKAASLTPPKSPAQSRKRKMPEPKSRNAETAAAAAAAAAPFFSPEQRRGLVQNVPLHERKRHKHMLTRLFASRQYSDADRARLDFAIGNRQKELVSRTIRLSRKSPFENQILSTARISQFQQRYQQLATGVGTVVASTTGPPPAAAQQERQSQPMQLSEQPKREPVSVASPAAAAAKEAEHAAAEAAAAVNKEQSRQEGQVQHQSGEQSEHCVNDAAAAKEDQPATTANQREEAQPQERACDASDSVASGSNNSEGTTVTADASVPPREHVAPPPTVAVAPLVASVATEASPVAATATSVEESSPTKAETTTAVPEVAPKVTTDTPRGAAVPAAAPRATAPPVPGPHLREGYAARNLEAVKDEILEYHASNQGQPSNSLCSFALEFNECSLAAIARWAGTSASGGAGSSAAAPKKATTAEKKKNSISKQQKRVDPREQYIVDPKFRRCSLCRLWGHYEGECLEQVFVPSALVGLEDMISSGGIAAAGSSDDMIHDSSAENDNDIDIFRRLGSKGDHNKGGAPPTYVVEKCQGFVIEQRKVRPTFKRGTSTNTHTERRPDELVPVSTTEIDGALITAVTSCQGQEKVAAAASASTVSL